MFNAILDRQYTEFCIEPMEEIEIQEMNIVEKAPDKVRAVKIGEKNTQSKLLSFFNSLRSPIE